LHWQIRLRWSLMVEFSCIHFRIAVIACRIPRPAIAKCIVFSLVGLVPQLTHAQGANHPQRVQSGVELILDGKYSNYFARSA